ncbi:la-related protein 1C-like isoform X2 [Aristolochia californica]|uniref:la-related protein 1C-like isoform X2 n=1 Tax=Aristolochia californica TaxID=171875 RepID=UPI0035D58C30
MATTADGLNSPQFRRGARNFASPWAHVVRGESEVAATAPGSPVSSSGAAVDVSVHSDRSENSPVESRVENSDNNGSNAAAGKTKKPAWNKPANGVIEVGPVMGAVSWPALSESTRASPKSSSDFKPPSDGSVHVSQAVTSNANPSPTPNHAFPIRQKSMKRGDRGTANGAPASAVPTASETPQSVSEKAVSPTKDSSPHKGSSNSEPGLKGGFVPQSHVSNDQPRNSFRRAGPHPRGDGHYNGNYGNRRDQDRPNYEWNPHRNFSNRDVHMQQPRPVPRGGFMRPPPTSGPFITPPRPFGNQMGFPDMTSPVYYVPAPHPDALRGVQFMPHPGPPPMFFPGPDPQLRAVLVKQIDYYFSSENLCKDIYLRQNMDEQGWVPISLIAGFNRVRQLTTNVQFILEALRTSSVVEVQGDKIRKCHDWMNWPLSPHRQLAAPHGPAFSPKSSYDALATQFLNVVLEEGSSNRNNFRGQMDTQIDGVLSRSSSGESSHSAVVSGTQNGEGTDQISNQAGNDRALSTRSSGMSC